MSIPTSLIVVLLVVAWLVVLVPMVARRREKVPQAEPAGSNFRVLRRASASLRRRPGRGAKGRTVTEMDRQGDSAPETSTEVLVTVGADQRDEPMDAADEWAAAQAAHARRTAPQQAPRDADQSTGFADVADERDDDQVALWSDEPDNVGSVDEGSVDGGSSADEFGRDEFGRNDDAQGDVVQPSRFLAEDRDAADLADAGPSARVIADEVDEDEWAAHAAAAPAGTYAEVDDEQLRPVPHRPGRGGFDPEAAEATRAYRYQQRRRVTLILTDRDRRLHRHRCTAAQLAVDRCRAELRAVDRLPRVSAPSGPDRGDDPAEADGAAAAGQADPARVRQGAPQDQVGAVRGRAGPHGGRS